ncbi:MAG: hypothetical protein ACH37Z_16370 [Anaerolineae bacterium]
MNPISRSNLHVAPSAAAANANPQPEQKKESNLMKQFAPILLASAVALGAALVNPAASHAQSAAGKPAKAPLVVEQSLPKGNIAPAMSPAKRQNAASAEDPNWIDSYYANAYIEYFGDYDDWTFSVGRNDNYILVQMNRFSGNLDPFISIYDPWGRRIYLNDDANIYTLNSAVYFRPSWQGVYTVRAQAQNALQLGGYTLWVHKSNLPMSY